MMKKYLYSNSGVTLMELMIVVGIIGVLATISMVNIGAIITGHRFRSSANDLLVKARSTRALALAKRRQLELTINTTDQSFRVDKTAHTEYDLLEDIAGAISKTGGSYANLSSFVLYEENAIALEQNVEIGGSINKNGIDVITTDCPGNKITFNPSGTLEPTCTVTIKNTKLNRQYDLKIYKGGQMILKRRA